MKTQINNGNFVSEAAILAVLLLLQCVLPSANVGAQTVQSAQYICATHYGEDVVLRESSSGWQIISYHGMISEMAMGACFEYGDLHSNAVKQFYIPDTLQTTGSIQYLQKMHSTPHTLVDMKYLYNTEGDESSAAVGLLHLTEDRFRTVVEYPYALISSYTDAVPRALMQRLENDAMRSMSAYHGNDVRFGGNSTSKVACLQEILPGIDAGSLCMQNGETEVLTIDHSQYPARGKKELSCQNEGLKDMFWETKTVYPKPVEVTNMCIYY
ncbi:MAG: hypothetical protein IJK84_08415 [Bacteroidales bacterium]|nr:hypothetical protein [Bacteroidales bacterium]